MTESRASAGGDQSQFDDAALDRLRRFGGGKLLTQMISLYLEAVPERLDAARRGLRAGDASEVERALHSLKSSSAQLGALHVQRLCEEGEREARAGSLSGTPAIMAALDAEMPLVVSWLERATAREGT